MSFVFYVTCGMGTRVATHKKSDLWKDFAQIMPSLGGSACTIMKTTVWHIIFPAIPWLDIWAASKTVMKRFQQIVVNSPAPMKSQHPGFQILGSWILRDEAKIGYLRISISQNPSSDFGFTDRTPSCKRPRISFTPLLHLTERYCPKTDTGVSASMVNVHVHDGSSVLVKVAQQKIGHPQFQMRSSCDGK